MENNYNINDYLPEFVHRLFEQLKLAEDDRLDELELILESLGDPTRRARYDQFLSALEKDKSFNDLYGRIQRMKP